MNRRTVTRIPAGVLSLSLVFLGSMIAAPGQQLSSQDQQSLDFVKTGSLAGNYRGLVHLPGGVKPATLTLIEGLADTNFVLQIKGEETIKGRIAGSFYPNSKAAFASLKVFEEPEVVGATESSSLSLRLVKTEDGVTLKRGARLLFEPCLRYPKCEGVSGCEPCEP